MWAFTGHCDLWMKLSLEHVPTYLVCPQKFTFLTLCTEEANGVSKAANSKTSLQLYCLHIFCAYRMTEQSFGDTRACFSIGWFHAVVDWPVTSLKIMCDSPLLQWEPKDNKNVVFVVSVNFCGAVGKQQDLYSFQLIAALRDSTKKYVPKISLSQITNCSLSYVYVD